ncbi:MAG: FHA domain-containing protein [Deltaproteobacteria bacterium]|nr:FHA domain-containing protein [Deltaproteobacteria bacterium]
MALKFLSGKYRGSEFPLDWEREFIIGRAPEIELSLVEDLVSRKHARISTRKNTIVLEDLGSTNGTFVNGERIKRVLLKDGDRILIGTSILALGPYDGHVPQSPQSDVEATVTAPALFGSLAAVPVSSLVDLLSTSRKSGTLVIRSDRIGRIVFNDGKLTAASIDDQPDCPSQKAFFRILSFMSGNYTLESNKSDAASTTDSIELATAPLLMEGLRQLDEMRHLRETRQIENPHFSLPAPLAVPLTDLSTAELTVFQLALNFGSLQPILDASHQTDLETLQALLSLADRGYLDKQSPE